MNITRMNIALLGKWWFRFKYPTVSGKWKTILINKYGSSGLHIPRISYFWKGVLKYKDIYDLGITRIIHNGRDTAFWLDRWIDSIILSVP